MLKISCLTLSTKKARTIIHSSRHYRFSCVLPPEHSSMASQTRPFDHSNIFIESRCILTSNYLHFLLIAFAFFFPLWFSLISLPSVLQTIIISFPNSSLIFLALIHGLVCFSLSVAGIATIIYSTHQAFNRTPLRLFTTIKLLSISFFPLASTILTFLVSLMFILIVPLICTGLFIHVIKTFRFEIDHGSYYFFLFCVLASIIVGLFLVFCQVYCVLASVVSVVESEWGFEPLRQSYYLIKEMRFVSLTSLFQYGIVNWVIVLGFSYPITFFHHIEWNYLDLIQVGITSLFEAWLIVQFVAASTVLYLYNKSLNCESTVQSDNEISEEYTRLAMDDIQTSDESRIEKASDWSGIIRICCVLVIIILFLHILWFYHR